MKQTSSNTWSRSSGIFPALAIAVSLLASSNVSQADIVISVSGGNGTALTLEVTQGDTFTATGPDVGDNIIGIVFQNLFQGTPNETSTTTTAADGISLGGSTDITGRLMGTTPTGVLNNDDLFVDWTRDTSTSDSITLTTGSRTTTSAINIDYTGLNLAGSQAFLKDSAGTLISAGINYTVVPEPSTYAAISGLLLVAVAAVRRRTLARV
jgi:hypothetical protein